MRVSAAALILALAMQWGAGAAASANSTSEGGGGLLRIALYSGPGTSFSRAHLYGTLVEGLRIHDVAFRIWNLTASQVRLQLTRSAFDVVIFPGGSGGGQARAIGSEGLAAVKSFVAAGGGYVGTCGGSYLAVEYLKFFGDHVVPKQPWNRGDGDVEVEFSSRGLRDLRLDASKYGGRVRIMYGQGPILDPASLPSSVITMATFRTEIHSKHTAQTTGQMVNTPAVTATTQWGGRVLVNSPHPELTDPTIPELYYAFVEWVLRGSAVSVLV